MQPSPQYLTPLTGVRALAALLVVLFHAQGLLPAATSSAMAVLDHGYFGVDLFFILSGFIITHVYLSKMSKPSWKATRIFLWHRFIRIYPVHLAVLLGLMVLLGIASALGLDAGQPELWRIDSAIWQFFMLQALSASASQQLEHTRRVHQRRVDCLSHLSAHRSAAYAGKDLSHSVAARDRPARCYRHSLFCVRRIHDRRHVWMAGHRSRCRGVRVRRSALPRSHCRRTISCRVASAI